MHRYAVFSGRIVRAATFTLLALLPLLLAACGQNNGGGAGY